MLLIDSHAHLDDRRFNRDREELIASFKEDKLEAVINIGIDLETSKQSIDMAKRHEPIYATVGYHPHNAKELTDEILEELRVLAGEEEIVAIGEIGLDFHYDNSPRDVQKYWFKKQLELAKEVDLPVVIHSRDATEDTMEILKEAQDGSLRGVLHCYSGSVQTAREYIDLGFYISLAGPVTFNNARMPKEVAKSVPLDRLLVETDAPYLTPEPYRGKRNDPSKVINTADEIARLRGISLEELARATNANTKRLFNLD